MGVQTSVWTRQCSLTINHISLILYLLISVVIRQRSCYMRAQFIRGIFVLTFKAHGPYWVQSIRLKCQNKYFLLLMLLSVSKDVLFLCVNLNTI